MDIELSTENRFYRDSHSSDEEREKSGIVCGGKGGADKNLDFL